MRLSPRLKMMADMVRPGVVVADIGTDHAYLPIYLLKKHICSTAIAADIKQGPLENARTSVALANLGSKIDVRLSDGLDRIEAHEAQDIIIAGMGGILIVDLLARTPWLRDGEKRLLLQPMAHAELVREYLCKNGFKILFEQACFDDGRDYIALCASFQDSSTQDVDPAYYYTGELPKTGNPAANKHIKRTTKHLTKRVNALTESGRKPKEVARLQAILKDMPKHSV
ncbi:MAG TPA: class I SAM-dependent methyltransferase [Clostridia bacterium]|nr:class I SAM-dependent methyltransferase [Clostridia bacterium]